MVKKLADDPNSPTMKDITSLQNEAFKNLSTEDINGVKTPPSMEQVKSYIRNAIDMRRELSGPDREVILPEKPVSVQEAAKNVMSPNKEVRIKSLLHLQEAARGGDEQAKKAILELLRSRG
jgi:hypothetical protein